MNERPSSRWCFDIGNTRTKIAVFGNKKTQPSQVYTVKELDKQLLRKLYDKHQPEAAIVSSVKGRDKKLCKWLEKRSRWFVELDYKTPIPIVNKYQTPQTLGMDRLANMVAVSVLFPDRTSLVIDAGTCIKYDLLFKGKVYGGGSISLGLEMRARALHEFTAALPLVKVDRVDMSLGTTTETALQTGISLGFVSEVMGFVSSFQDFVQGEELQLVLTGGDMDFLAKYSPIPNVAEQHLVLIGLDQILQYNAR